MDYDIVICGGGLVGRSLACALAKLPIRIAVIESLLPTLTQQADFDTRSFAISYGNALFLKQIGIWEQLAGTATPIKTIHVSDKGHVGITRLTAKEQRVAALGYIVLAPYLNTALQQSVLQHANISLFCPAKVTDIACNPDNVKLTITKGTKTQQISAKLVVAADGTHSTIRELLAIPVKQQNYGQTAIIANVGLSRHHDHTAYERFTPSGPLALLPLPEKRCGLVWTVKPEQVARMMSLPDKEFLTELQLAFGYRLGRFTTLGKRFSYPLQLWQAQQLVKSRVVLVGNAAHTLHPIAGQGFNLGLRDVAALSRILATVITQQHDIGLEQVLNRYEKQQAQDHRLYIRFTDGLVKIFSSSLWPISLARNMGLKTLNLVPALKNRLTRKAMGLSL
jgi:2-octaprenyl-6-methoxyphenol hydroxylase